MWGCSATASHRFITVIFRDDSPHIGAALGIRLKTSVSKARVQRQDAILKPTFQKCSRTNVHQLCQMSLGWGGGERGEGDAWETLQNSILHALRGTSAACRILESSTRQSAHLEHALKETRHAPLSRSMASAAASEEDGRRWVAAGLAERHRDGVRRKRSMALPALPLSSDTTTETTLRQREGQGGHVP